MKKMIGFLAVCMIFLSSLAYAGGDQVCGDNAAGPAGDTAGSDEPTQTRSPNP